MKTIRTNKRILILGIQIGNKFTQRDYKISINFVAVYNGNKFYSLK